MDQLAAKGLHGVFGADARTIGHPALLGWIHLDQPDMPELKKRINISCVGCRPTKDVHGVTSLFDGDANSHGRGWVDPLLGAQITVKLSKAVVKVFVQLYNEKLIYKDKRLVNWDPKLLTAISDLEVVQVETWTTRSI